MATKSITVSVSKRILHIGSAAYPLANIARVQSEELRIRRSPAIRAFIGQAVTWIVLGVAATFAIKIAHSQGMGGITYDSQQRYLSIVRLTSGILIGLSLVRLLIRLAPTWRRYYALMIETAGTPNAVIINPDRGLIDNLVTEITQALEDPDAAFVPPITVNNFNNYNFGQQNAQFGAKSTMRVP